MTATVLPDHAGAAFDGRTLAVEDPSTATTFAHVARGGAPDVDRAVTAARSCAPRLRATPPAERGRALRRLAAEVDGAREELARLETRDTGKPASLARAEIGGCVGYLEFYAGAADTLRGETIPVGPGSLAYTVPEPVGVSAHIPRVRCALVSRNRRHSASPVGRRSPRPPSGPPWLPLQPCGSTRPDDLTGSGSEWTFTAAAALGVHSARSPTGCPAGLVRRG
ncbi:aldehyde dehydrogenase family protein [Actinomycetospora sp.]|uniref:aldehyde dehydrogenase family protein n=1 Tax=Actinomycetospora sp. TaxID=1872135 RepID=UPI002F415802